MLFNSFEFLFLFLPLTLLGYFLISRLTTSANVSLAFLAFASLLFYSYWDLRFLPILLLSIIVNYLFGISLEKAKAHSKVAKIIFISAILANLSLLIFYKYLNFGLNILSHLTGKEHAPLALILPLGISFFTFTQLAYLIDVYLGHPKEKNFIKYLLFVTYFPHLIAGPILHHKEMMSQFTAKETRSFSVSRIAMGLTVLAIGLVKKLLIADTFAHIADPIFDNIGHLIIPMQDAWGAALAYTLQIYFDFSAYCDMAVGISIMFGIALPFNFDAPYKAQSIAEFWRRWHITLSRFLRDYVYISLGGNKQGKPRRYLNLLLTMLIGGIWHGAGWTYIIWGYLHGCYLMVNHFWRGYVDQHPFLLKLADKRSYAIFSLLLTQLAVIVAWVYFRADSVRKGNRLLGMMFHVGKFRIKGEIAPLTLGQAQLWMIVCAYLACLLLPNIRSIFEKWNLGLTVYDNPEPLNLLTLKWKLNTSWAVLTGCMLIAAIFTILVIGDGSQFLYFQF